MVELTLKEKEKFFKNQRKVGTVIINHVKKKGLILFGQKATNRQLPEDLRKDTQDYDIFSPTPKKSANRIEKKLDDKLEGDFFLVREAMHKGTYKVIQRIGDKGIVDVSKPENKIPTVTRKGVKLATLEFQKKQIKKSLADKDSKFRHAKDKEVRARIRIAEQRKKTSKPKKKKVSHRISHSSGFNLPEFQVNTKVNF